MSMELKIVDIKEFKKNIYPEYKKIFPEIERKSYRCLKKTYKNNIMKIIEILVDDELVGFFILNLLKGNSYIQLDYFAILPEYQHRGYGTQAIKILKNMYQQYDGIFIEIEKLNCGENEEENRIRQRRAKFYENLGFYKLDFDLDMYTVIYSAYILPCQKNEFIGSEVIKEIYKIYKAILGEKRTEKNCKVLNI